MKPPAITVAVEPIALRREQAAAVLSMSVESFDEHVRRDVKAIRRGRLTLYPTTELERWARENASAVLGENR
jgi:hypothetical protein